MPLPPLIPNLPPDYCSEYDDFLEDMKVNIPPEKDTTNESDSTIERA